MLPDSVHEMMSPIMTRFVLSVFFSYRAQLSYGRRTKRTRICQKPPASCSALFHGHVEQEASRVHPILVHDLRRHV